jgi:hypothetical protein
MMRLRQKKVSPKRKTMKVQPPHPTHGNLGLTLLVFHLEASNLIIHYLYISFAPVLCDRNFCDKKELILA